MQHNIWSKIKISNQRNTKQSYNVYILLCYWTSEKNELCTTTGRSAKNRHKYMHKIEVNLICIGWQEITQRRIHLVICLKIN